MRLDECKIGAVVIVKHAGGSYGNIGHIVGFTYNTEISSTQYPNPEVYNQVLRNNTIPVVAFPNTQDPIHHFNLELFNDDITYIRS